MVFSAAFDFIASESEFIFIFVRRISEPASRSSARIPRFRVSIFLPRLVCSRYSSRIRRTDFNYLLRIDAKNKSKSLLLRGGLLSRSSPLMHVPFRFSRKLPIVDRSRKILCETASGEAAAERAREAADNQKGIKRCVRFNGSHNNNKNNKCALAIACSLYSHVGIQGKGRCDLRRLTMKKKHEKNERKKERSR